MHLLVDGKNLLYRAVLSSNERDPFVNACKLLYYYYLDSAADQIHVFWDAPKDQLWRKDIYKDYKEGRITPGADDTKNALDRCKQLCEELWPNLAVRTYYRHRMEADDLIYAFCHANKSDDITVVSSDKDMHQLPYYFDNVKLRDPRTKQIVERPKINPVIAKCLWGDDSDNIEGYPGIGKVKSAVIAENRHKLYGLLAKRGKDILMRNIKLVDMALCPYLFENMVYVLDVMSKPIAFNKEEIKNSLNKHKIDGSKFIYYDMLTFSRLEEHGNACCIRSAHTSS